VSHLRSRVRAAFAAASIACASLAMAPVASAQSAQLSTRASSREVEVGQTFTVQLTAMVEQGQPTPRQPMLRVPPGISVHGPSVATQQQISLSGGKFMQRMGIAATWTLEASRTGRYRIGPATVDVGGRMLSGDVVEVQVSPPGTRPRPKGFDPFDPFSFGLPSMPSLPFQDPDLPSEEPSLPPFPEELRVSRPLDSLAFLRAVVSPKRAVVGEQVTLDIYAYGARGPFRETYTSEPSREAFLSQTLLENSYSEPMYRVPVGGTVWNVKKVRELALFPIQAGKLTVGAMRLGFDGRGYPSAGQARGLVRYSEPLVVDVSEPPLAGRPPGYRLGDVGRYTLTARVEPREVSAGEAVSVVAKLEGTGSVPFTLRTPQQHGVRWLEPTQVEQIEPRGSTIGGWRKLTYIVHLEEAGEVDLGELSLPYWDPERETYDVAKASLGKVRVLPSSDSAPKIPEEPDALAGVMTLRKTLGSDPGARAPITDESWYWLALLLAPTSVVLTGSGKAAARRLRERAQARRESHASAVAKALGEARQAARDGKLPAVAAAVERAIVAGIEDASGLKARGILRAELESELRNAGVDDDVAREACAILDVCDGIRFTSSSEDATADELVSRTSDLTRKLGRQRGKS
jgi:hypothetical protein